MVVVGVNMLEVKLEFKLVIADGVGPSTVVIGAVVAVAVVVVDVVDGGTGVDVPRSAV